MGSLEMRHVIRSLQSAGIDAGRTDDGRYVWARVTRVDVETRTPFHDAVLIRDASDLRAMLRPTHS